MKPGSQGPERRGLSMLAAPVLTLTVLLLAGCGASAPADTTPYPTSTSTPVADPIRIEIPSIEVDATVVAVGLKADGALDVPDFGLAGWYEPGPRPGEVGPAVIVAHVDTRSGPDVFARLAELQAGDSIVVHAGDGTARTFAAEQSEQTPKDELPADRIWGDTDRPVLRLITCGGSFDSSTGHYRDNVIVYAGAAEVPSTRD